MRGIGIFVASALLLAACSLENNDNNFRRDVLDCESALSVLGACCPGFDTHAVRCDYHLEECCVLNAESKQETLPAYGIDESDCIMSESCDALRANGVCARAQVANPNATMPTAPVCP